MGECYRSADQYPDGMLSLKRLIHYWSYKDNRHSHWSTSSKGDFRFGQQQNWHPALPPFFVFVSLWSPPLPAASCPSTTRHVSAVFDLVRNESLQTQGHMILEPNVCQRFSSSRLYHFVAFMFSILLKLQWSVCVFILFDSFALFCVNAKNDTFGSASRLAVNGISFSGSFS